MDPVQYPEILHQYDNISRLYTVQYLKILHQYNNISRLYTVQYLEISYCTLHTVQCTLPVQSYIIVQ